ncbi:MAG: J domain-containing protein [Alphaproteobacteria bacterium]|nr:MAG: J domain-containing protein [Alphaproteobacteria bacterium]
MSSTPSFFSGRLVIGADAFAYNGKRHAYADVDGLEFKHRTLAARADSNTGPLYVVLLRVLLKSGKAVTIKPEDTLRQRVSTHDKVVFETLKTAADWLGAYTFDQRMDGYEAALKQHGYVSWGKHQITPRGDLFYRNAYCMNLLPTDIRCMLYPFHMACLRRPHAWWKRMLQTFVRNGEIVDLRRDRDCFLYFARRYVGLTWPNETLRVYRGVLAEGVKEQPKDEPKAQTQEQPRAQQQEQPRQEQRRETPPPPPPRAKTMPSHVQHLATLGLSPDVPWDTVKTRYRQLVRQHHPDLMRGKGAKEAAIKQAEETLKGINEAYAWLEDFYKMK